MRRLNGDWISHYVEFITGTSESPYNYHVWSAATAIGGVLKRHCWLNRGDWRLFPNLYTVLVGHPGIGKGRAINPVVALLREAGCCNLMSDKLTIQYILETISKGFGQAQVHATAAGAGLTFGFDYSCLISAPELTVFLTNQDALPSLAELWEAKDGPSDYGTRSKGLYKIQKPCPTILAGCTPRQIVRLMPTEVVGSGFTRRINFVYATEKACSIPWPSATNGYDSTRLALVDDLRYIATLTGEFTFTPQASKRFEEFYESIQIDEFTDEVTSNYETSKWANAAKLAMIFSASRCDCLQIDLQDIDLAITSVNDCLDDLHKVFSGVGESELTLVTDKVLRYIEAKGFVTRQQLLGALWRDVGSSQNLDVILATLESGGLLYAKDTGGRTVYRTVPQGAKP